MTLEHLICHSEITFNNGFLLRYALSWYPFSWRPHDRSVTLASSNQHCGFRLNVESADHLDRCLALTHGVVVGRIQSKVCIRPMSGTVNDDPFDAYLLKFRNQP